MSEREHAQEILQNIPENKLILVITYMQGVLDAAEMDDIPNEETVKALEETNKAIRDGALKPFTGNTEEFLSAVLTEDE